MSLRVARLWGGGEYYVERRTSERLAVGVHEIRRPLVPGVYVPAAQWASLGGPDLAPGEAAVFDIGLVCRRRPETKGVAR